MSHTGSSVQPKPKPMTTHEFGHRGHAAPVCGIMISTSTIHAIISITTHLSTPEEWRANWPCRQFTDRVVTCQQGAGRESLLDRDYTSELRCQWRL